MAGDLPEGRDSDEADSVQGEDGSWLIDGMADLDEVERVLARSGMKSEHDYHTLAGFVLWHLGHVPKIGESFAWNGMRFEVIDMDGRRVDRVLVSPEEPAAPRPGDRA